MVGDCARSGRVLPNVATATVFQKPPRNPATLVVVGLAGVLCENRVAHTAGVVIGLRRKY